MEIKNVDNQKKWDGWLIQNQQFGIFSQSWFWGEILQSEGKNIERISVIENGEIIAQAQLVYHALPFGWKYSFCPKGPVVKISNFQFRSQRDHFVVSKQFSIYNELIYKKMAEYLIGKRCIFFRFEPHDISLRGITHRAAKYIIHNTTKTIDINPRATTVLDLSKTESELLQAMHQKTRYNIRLAEKKNLKVEEKKDFDAFINLSRQTSQRDGFKLHNDSHYYHIIFSSASHQLNVFNEGKIVAIGILIGFGNNFTYLYGASDYNSRHLMAPYVLQWEGIKLGKKLGYQYYDFFGIAPQSLKHKNIKILKQTISEYQYDKNHPYTGITRFKIGFGGIVKEDSGTFDIIFSPIKYIFYKILRKINRLIKSGII